MKLGIIGLGTMGANMAERLVKAGHEVVGYDLSENAVQAVQERGADKADSISGLVGKLTPPRIVWLMVPAGDAVDKTIESLTGELSDGDIIVDGGNSNYKDTLRRAETVQQAGLHFVDAGTSGGVWGLEQGYSLMVGGEAKPVEQLRPILEALAPGVDKGWGHVGPPGAGHFVKMVHNGIEYGMMEAYAEGFSILQGKEEFSLDLHQIAEIWRFGSVIRSWLLDLTAQALEENGDLSGIAPYVEDSGEGRWTVKEAVDLDIPAPVITLALQRRFGSRIEDSFAEKMLAAMRHAFGGHAVTKEANT